jgi:hypothetical protein
MWNKKKLHFRTSAEVSKLWADLLVPGAKLVLWGDASCLYEGHTYFEQNMEAR